jgi:hypothetical protein
MDKADAFYRALGEFITEFAWVESLVCDMLVRETGVSFKIGAAVFSGVRIDAAKDLIGRLYEARGAERSAELVRAFAQLGLITRVRNDILHYGAVPNPEGEAIVSNSRAAHSARALREMRVSRETLQQMTSDLVQISLVLMDQITWGEDTPFVTWEREEDYDWIVARPWRYKLEKPSHRENERPQKPSTPKRPSEA